MTITFVGEKLSPRVLLSMKAGNPFEFDELCVTSFAILLQEFESLPLTEHPERLKFILAIYLEYSGAVDKLCTCPGPGIWLKLIPVIQAKRNSTITLQELAKGLISRIMSICIHLFPNRYRILRGCRGTISCSWCI
jgi:hypothetical protein